MDQPHPGRRPGVPLTEAELRAEFQLAADQLASLQIDLQQTLDKIDAQPLLTDEEREALEKQAASGKLGPEMKELVGKIQKGEDSWEAVFAGESANASLLQGHLTKLVADNIEEIQLAFEDLVDAEEEKGNFFLDELPQTKD